MLDLVLYWDTGVGDSCNTSGLGVADAGSFAGFPGPADLEFARSCGVASGIGFLVDWVGVHIGCVGVMAWIVVGEVVGLVVVVVLIVDVFANCNESELGVPAGPSHLVIVDSSSFSMGLWWPYMMGGIAISERNYCTEAGYRNPLPPYWYLVAITTIIPSLFTF